MVQIPEPAKERLLHLMRILERNGPGLVTSSQVEELTGWLEKDALGSCCNPESLIPAIKKALGLDQRRRFCVVGLGRLGSAYLNVRSFEFEEFELAAGFDANVTRVEILQSPVPLYPVYKMAEIISRFSIEIALLCVPEGAAQTAADKLSAAGIRGILNFTPAVLTVPPETAVRNVYAADELRALAMQIAAIET